MNLLLDELPESVYLADPDPPYLEREYPIATDYRVGIQFTQLLSDEGLTNLKKDEQALMLYYGGIPANVEAAYQALTQFYLCGRDPEDIATGGHSGPPVFSYAQDAPYLFAAFEQQYGIDLTTAKLHWWRFRALFDGLSDKTELVKIMGYRAWKPYKGCPKEEAAHMRKLQKHYALVESGERKRSNQLADILMGDGDLSRLNDD
jgi:hypothetical protein